MGRIYIADLQESVYFLKYRPKENDLYVYADDTIPRYVTAMCQLDYDTVAVADKFGNVSVLRLPLDSSSKVEEALLPPNAFQTNNANKTTLKIEAVCNFHVGDVITSLQKVVLQPGGNEVILYAT